MATNSRLLLVGAPSLLLCISALVGCQNDEKNARAALEEAVEACRQAEVDGPYYALDVIGEEPENVLAITCKEEITGFEMLDQFEAKAMTGPTEWRIGQDADARIWLPMSAKWRALDEAIRALDEDDPSPETRQYVEEKLASAQSVAPESSFIRIRRLENLLELRATERRKTGTQEPWTLGQAAQSHLDETLSWATERDQDDVAAQARFMALETNLDYQGYLEMAIDSLGSQDEWLEKSIKASEKDEDFEAAQETRKELEQRRADRPRKRAQIEERMAANKAFMCERATQLNPSDVSETSFKKRISGLKQSLGCMETANDPEEG